MRGMTRHGCLHELRTHKNVSSKLVDAYLTLEEIYCMSLCEILNIWLTCSELAPNDWQKKGLLFFMLIGNGEKQPN